jgi:hypothetical protein
VSAVFKKLNLKNEKEILVLNAPDSFELELAALEGIIIKRSPAQAAEIQFSLAFVTQQTELDALSKAIAAKTKGDALVWFVYPKSSSKKYKCEFNRDSGWAVLGELGFEPVRQIAIDEDWSALRFRRVEYIKTMIRSQQGAISQAGRERTRKDP